MIKEVKQNFAKQKGYPDWRTMMDDLYALTDYDISKLIEIAYQKGYAQRETDKQDRI